jgi:putative NADPH-quinone reductase
MKVLVIIAHPDLETSKINRTWMMELQKHEDVTVHPLYQTYPDGVIDVEKEQALVQAHDRIVFQFPFYWYSSPHLLHWWQEKVLTFGWAYGPGAPGLVGKQFMLAVSTGGAANVYQAGGHNNYSMSELLKPFQQMTNLLGAKYLSPFVFHGARTASQEQIDASAQEYAACVLAK